MTEFAAGNHTYRITGRLDAMTQHKLVKRLGPAFASIITAFRENPAANPVAAMIDNAPVLMQALSGISDEDSDYIILTCCSVVAIRQGDMWSVVAGPAGLMFETLDLAELYQITGRVLGDSLGPFFRTFLSLFLPEDQGGDQT